MTTPNTLWSQAVGKATYWPVPPGVAWVAFVRSSQLAPLVQRLSRPVSTVVLLW